MWWRNYTQTFFQNMKIDHIPGSIAEGAIQFVFNVWQVEDYRSILKLSCRPLVFTSYHRCSYKAFLRNKKTSGTSL